MSFLVAVKEDGIIYVGCDSEVIKDGSRTTLKSKNNYEIWKIEDFPFCIMVSDKNIRDANVVRLIDDMITDYDANKGNADNNYVGRLIIKALRDAHYIRSYDGSSEVKEPSFIFAFKDQLFSINYDGEVVESEDFVVIGSRRSEATISLLSTTTLPAKERVIRAIKASVASDIYVDNAIILTSTSSEDDFEVITKENESKYLSK